MPVWLVHRRVAGTVFPIRSVRLPAAKHALRAAFLFAVAPARRRLVQTLPSAFSFVSPLCRDTIAIYLVSFWSADGSKMGLP